jgi:hypothetical protein
MGWTHYWQRDIDLPKDKFAQAAADCLRVTQFLSIPLGNYRGTSQPIFDDEEILFNGLGNTGCEGFEIYRYQLPKRPGQVRTLSYCKTEHMPYDICVQAVLIVMKHHLGNAIMVNSDSKDGDWDKARKACQECLGYSEDFWLQKEEE